MNIRISFLLGLILLALCVAAAGVRQDLPKTLVGKSSCSPELSAAVKYGARLDRIQRAYLSAYALQSLGILTIVQYRQDGDKCGVIRDAISSEHKDDSFVFECVDRRFPAEVVVGTWPSEHPKPRGTALQAWRIDLKNLKFIPDEQASRFVYCNPQSGVGYDDGLGLSDYAKKRAAKHPSD